MDDHGGQQAIGFILFLLRSYQKDFDFRIMQVLKFFVTLLVQEKFELLCSKNIHWLFQSDLIYLSTTGQLSVPTSSQLLINDTAVTGHIRLVVVSMVSDIQNKDDMSAGWISVWCWRYLDTPKWRPVAGSGLPPVPPVLPEPCLDDPHLLPGHILLLILPQAATGPVGRRPLQLLGQNGMFFVKWKIL